MSKRIKKTVLFIALGLLLLASLGYGSSRKTVVGVWDGMFPSGEFRIIVGDKTGIPIKGATLSVFQDNIQEFSFGYPIDNYLSDGDLISNEQGIIIVLHKPRGLEFGGVCWKRYWVFEECSAAPKYDLYISASGYKTLKFSTDELFAPAYSNKGVGTTSILNENGQEIEISMYEIRFTLQK